MDTGTARQPTVTVLLSVYRGRKYLEELLESLQAQFGANLQLLYLLDDGDSSPEAVIRTYIPGACRLDVPAGNGVPVAFLKLLESAPIDSDYYCFADQDDVWLPGKLDHAVRALAGCSNGAALWASRVRPFRDVDRRREFDHAYPHSLPRPSWRHSLVENVGPGCAMVWNKALQSVLAESGNRKGIMMHDWWVYAVASITGRVILEPDPFVLYRLHQSNAVGIDKSLVSRFRRLIRRTSPYQASIETQAQALLDAYRNRMTKEQVSVVSDIAGQRRFRKFLRAARGDVYRTSRAEYPLLCGRMLWR